PFRAPFPAFPLPFPAETIKNHLSVGPFVAPDGGVRIGFGHTNQTALFPPARLATPDAAFRRSEPAARTGPPFPRPAKGRGTCPRPRTGRVRVPHTPERMFRIFSVPEKASDEKTSVSDNTRRSPGCKVCHPPEWVPEGAKWGHIREIGGKTVPFFPLKAVFGRLKTASVRPGRNRRVRSGWSARRFLPGPSPGFRPPSPPPGAPWRARCACRGGDGGPDRAHPSRRAAGPPAPSPPLPSVPRRCGRSPVRRTQGKSSCPDRLWRNPSRRRSSA